MRAMLSTHGFNAIGRECEWDHTRFDPEHAQGTAHEFDRILCGQDHVPHPAPFAL
jgi:hypothetical protein